MLKGRKITKEFLKRHSLIFGILLTFLLTWPIDLSNGGVLPFKVPFALSIFLGWGLIFASLIATGRPLAEMPSQSASSPFCQINAI